MALRHRDIVSTIADRENINVKLVKAKAPLQKPSVRPALDDLGNKLNATRAVLKKPLQPVKDAKKKNLIKENTLVKPEKAIKSLSSQQIEKIRDPDADCQNEPQMVTEYINDIYEYLRELEQQYPIHENFLEGHQSSPNMRAILINWLVQVHLNFKLCLETLYLCVSTIDRYLQENQTVCRKNLQLVGTGALMIACKYEELYLPDLNDYVYICDNAFSKRQILAMEMDILRTLDFKLGRPSPIQFLRRYSKIAQVQIDQHSLSKYILELGLLDHSLSHIRPSIQAAAACCLSLTILNDFNGPSTAWTPTLEYYTTYKYSDFKNTLIKYANLLLNSETSKHDSIRSKYAAAALNKISTNPKLKGSLVKRLAQSLPNS